MARISKPGLDYFPLDVNFFQDRKVRRMMTVGNAAYLPVLEEVDIEREII